MSDLTPEKTNVFVCEMHAGGLASGILAPPGFLSCIVCERAVLRNRIAELERENAEQRARGDQLNRELSAFLKSAGKQSHKEKVSDLVRGILDVANRLPKQEPYGKLFGYASAVIELERALSLANDANGTIEAALLDARRENAELRQQVTNQLAFCSPSAELSKIIDDSCLCKDPHCDECQQMLYAIGAIEVRMKAAESVSHEPSNVTPETNNNIATSLREFADSLREERHANGGCITTTVADEFIAVLDEAANRIVGKPFEPLPGLAAKVQRVYDSLHIDCDPVKEWHIETLAEVVRALNGVSSETCECCTPERKCPDHGAALTSNDD